MHKGFGTLASLLGLCVLASLTSGCARAEEATASASSAAAGEDCTSIAGWDIPICNTAGGRFKATWDHFGSGALAALGLPLNHPYQDGNGDWYQTFERVEMNGNFGKGCEEGRACLAHLGRWDLEREGRSVGDQFVDCQSEAVAPREKSAACPRIFSPTTTTGRAGSSSTGTC